MKREFVLICLLSLGIIGCGGPPSAGEAPQGGVTSAADVGKVVLKLPGMS